MKPSGKMSSTRFIALFFPIAFLIWVSFLTLPLLRQGQGAFEAFAGLFRSPRIWTEAVVPFGIIYLLMLVFGSGLHELLLRDQRNGMKRNWRKARRTYTFLGLLTLIGTGILVGWRFFQGQSFSWDQITVLAILGIAYCVLVIGRWFMKPDSDLVSAFESGNDSKYVDERRQTVIAKSAETALHWIMGLFLIGGTLYDLLVTRMWPVRTVFEAVLIGIIWFIAYQKWDREL